MTRILDRTIDKARHAAFDEIWNVGFVEQAADDIVRRGLVGNIVWMPAPSRGTILADPSFLRRSDGGSTWFAEFLDLAKPPGEIWTADLDPDASPASAHFRPALAEPFHMSYPTPFVDDSGMTRLTAEIWPADDTLIWTLGDEGWRRTGILFPGRPAVDPTLWRSDDRWWLFCTFRSEGPNERLFLFHAASLTGPWTPHRTNPVKTDAGSARPAGPIFQAGDRIIRPAQDCSRTYGGGIVLNEIVRLDEDAFEERQVRRLNPSPGAYPSGFHTICPAGDITLIDGKRWQLNPMKLVRRLKRLVDRS